MCGIVEIIYEWVHQRSWPLTNSQYHWLHLLNSFSCIKRHPILVLMCPLNWGLSYDYFFQDYKDSQYTEELPANRHHTRYPVCRDPRPRISEYRNLLQNRQEYQVYMRLFHAPASNFSLCSLRCGLFSCATSLRLWWSYRARYTSFWLSMEHHGGAPRDGWVKVNAPPYSDSSFCFEAG